jgi:hypothetical protein
MRRASLLPSEVHTRPALEANKFSYLRLQGIIAWMIA